VFETFARFKQKSHGFLSAPVASEVVSSVYLETGALQEGNATPPKTAMRPAMGLILLR
jgi:hypothetical protein